MEEIEDIPYYTGIVTSIYDKYCAIEIDQKYILHMAIYYITHKCHLNNQHRLPSLNESIKLKNVQKYSKHLLMSSTSELISNNEYTVTEEDLLSFLAYLNFILTHKLNSMEIVNFYKYLLKAFKYDELLNIEESTEVLLCRTFDIILAKQHFHAKDFTITLFTPSNVIDFQNSYSKLEWNYDSSMSKENSYLLGYLFVNNDGCLCIEDIKVKIPCLIINKFNADMKEYLNQMIFVERFVTFREYYITTNENISYVLFDIRDIFRVNVNCKKQHISHLVNTRPTRATTSLYFQLIEKIPPNISPEGHIQQYLLIHDLTRKTPSYICLEKSLLSVIPLLETNCNYELLNSAKLSLKLHLKTISGYKVKGNNVLFYKMTNIVDSSAIKFKNETLISVEATILEKTFSKSLPSFGLLYPKVSGFNTPGLKTHGLKLLLNDGKTQYLYLNNWQALQNPLGLIPKMKVQINNIKLQNTYLKSTDLTSFHITDYELLPDRNDLDSFFIDENDFMDEMDIPSNIDSKCVPNNIDSSDTNKLNQTRTESTTTFITSDVLIEDIAIEINCNSCKKIEPTTMSCSDCESIDSCNKFSATLRIKDKEDIFINIQDFHLMKSLFSIPNFLWENLLENLETCTLKHLRENNSASNMEKWLDNAVNIFNTRSKKIKMDCSNVNNKWILNNIITDYDFGKW